MKIALYHNLPSGGGKRALYDITRHLDDRHTLDVYTLSNAEHDFCDLRTYCRIHEIFPFTPLPLVRPPLGRLNHGLRIIDLLRLYFSHRIVARRIDDRDYDVVFVHHCRYSQSPSLLQFLQTPSVYYCQEPPRLLYEPNVERPYSEFSKIQQLGNRFDPLPGLYRRMLAQLDRQNVKSATRVLVNSHYSRESLYHVYGVFPFVAYLGVDAEHFHPLSAPKADFVLSVGALNPRKGFDFIIRSLALIEAAKRPPLVIVSNFQNVQERRFLEQLAEEKHVAVTFRTMIADEELVQLYSQARLTLYAPIMEPFGFVPLESMACATPVVGVREGGIRETVPHVRGGILTERNPRQFADAIASLYSNEERIQQYGEAGRAYVEQNWRWARCVNEVERHLLSVLRDDELSLVDV